MHQFLPRTSAGFLWTVHIGLRGITLRNCFHKHNVAVVNVQVALETKTCLLLKIKIICVYVVYEPSSKIRTAVGNNFKVIILQFGDVMGRP